MGTVSSLLGCLIYLCQTGQIGLVRAQIFSTLGRLTWNDIFIDREAGEIICLVAPVCLFVCLFVNLKWVDGSIKRQIVGKQRSIKRLGLESAVCSGSFFLRFECSSDAHLRLSGGGHSQKTCQSSGSRENVLLKLVNSRN